MRRSVLVRFLGLSLAVALGAVIATAVIATYSTSEQLQGEIDTNNSQLQVDGEIYADLSTYASDHASWVGGGQAGSPDSPNETGRRIALADADGVDDRRLGQGARSRTGSAVGAGGNDRRPGNGGDGALLRVHGGRNRRSAPRAPVKGDDGRARVGQPSARYNGV